MNCASRYACSRSGDSDCSKESSGRERPCDPIITTFVNASSILNWMNAQANERLAAKPGQSKAKAYLQGFYERVTSPTGVKRAFVDGCGSQPFM